MRQLRGTGRAAARPYESYNQLLQSMTIEAGSRIGPYEIREPLGAGGMGEVYRARDSKLGRDIAIKILPPRSSENEKRMRRLEDEARAASSLNHPNIVTIYEIGYSDARPYISMELVEGRTLRHLIFESALPARRALDLCVQIAEGLAAAHGRGLVHRDLKPENVMVTRDSLAKILDFGLAKRSLEAESVHADQPTREFSDSHKTGAGAVVGTAAYMSPEQAAGKSIDFRSDQFSLGLILYETLTGKHPFHRATAVDTMSAIMHEEAEPIGRLNAKVPVPLQWIVDRCLAKDPDERYASTRDLARDLRAVRDRSVSGESAVVPPANRKWMAGILAGLVALAAAIGLLINRKDPPPPLPLQKTIVVLPFEDLSVDKSGNREFIGGLEEIIRIRLSKVAGIQVVATPRTVGISASSLDVRKIASEAGAALVLRGSVQKAGAQIRMNFSLLNPAGNIQLAGDSISGSISDVFSIHDQLAESVARALQMKGPIPRFSRHGLESAASQEHYLQAIGYLQRYDNEASIDGAIQRLRAIQQQEGDSALTLAALGRAFLFKYKLTRQSSWADEAMTACVKALSLDPRLPDVHLTMGELMTLSGRNTEAIDEFKKALAVNPSSADATIGLADAFALAGRPREAEETYRRAIEIQPSYWASYNKLGSFYYRNRDLKNAEKMFRKVIQLTPDNLRGYNNLGLIHLHTGRFDEAISWYNKSIALRPESRAYSNLGTLYYLKGQFRESSEAFEKAAAVTPHDALLWSNLGDAYRRIPGMESKALEAYQNAIRLCNQELRIAPRSGAIYRTLANSYAKSGDPARAEESMRKAIELSPADGDTMVHAAMMANMADRSDQALEWLKRAAAAGHSRALIAHDPEFANLRSREEFKRLIAAEVEPVVQKSVN